MSGELGILLPRNPAQDYCSVVFSLEARVDPEKDVLRFAMFLLLVISWLSLPKC